MNPERDKIYSKQLRGVYLQSAAERNKYKGRSYKRPPVGNLSALKMEKDISSDCTKEKNENISEIGRKSIVGPYLFETVSSSGLSTLKENKQEVVDDDGKEESSVKPFEFEKISYSELAKKARIASQRQAAEGKLQKVLEDVEKREKLEQKLTDMINRSNGVDLSKGKEKDIVMSTGVEMPSAVQQAITVAQYRSQREFELKDVLSNNTQGFKEKAESSDYGELVRPKVDPKEVILRQIREKTKEKEKVSVSKRESKKTSFFQKIKQKAHSIFQEVNQPKQDIETSLGKSKNDRKKFVARVKAATAAFIVMTLGIQVHSTVHEAEEDPSSQIKVSQDFISSSENSLDLSVEIGMGKVATVIEEQQTQSDLEVAAFQDTKVDETQFLLGQSIILNEDTKVYMNEQDAYLEENALSSYYSNQDERVIIGVLVEHEDSMMRFSANQENANEMLQSMLDDGGEVVSVLTANKNYVLPNYDGTTTLSAEEVNASAEGWYNVCDISLENRKTLCK